MNINNNAFFFGQEIGSMVKQCFEVKLNCVIAAANAAIIFVVKPIVSRSKEIDRIS